MKRFLMFMVVLGVLAAPLAYAQSSIFVDANKKKKDSAAAQEKSGGKSSVFIRPGASKSEKKPFFFKKSFRSNPRANAYNNISRKREHLAMPNMDMRGDKTPTIEELLTMVKANRQGDFEIMQKQSALTLARLEESRALREIRAREREDAKRIARRKSKLHAAQRSSAKSGGKKKRQVFVRKRNTNPEKPPRVFNTYD